MRFVPFTAGVLLVLLQVAVARSQTFRVETDIYVGSEKAPVLQTLTLFDADVVYDLVDGNVDEATVFDLERNRFILLDRKSQRKTELTKDEVLGYVGDVKNVVTREKPVLFAAANPVFQESYDEATHWLTLSSDHLTYRALGSVPSEEGIVARYQEFANWSARLNVLIKGSLPPFARLELNRQLAERGFVPSEVERTTVDGSGFLAKKSLIRAQHHFNWSLSNTDRGRIDKIGEELASFSPVSLVEFRQTPAVAKAE